MNMKLSVSLAQNIVQRTSRVLHKPINVMNETGIIIISSNLTVYSKDILVPYTPSSQPNYRNKSGVS